MGTFLATIVVVGLTMLALGIGVLVRGRSVQASCGGASTAAGCHCGPVRRAACRRKGTAE